MSQRHLLDLSLEELEAELASWGQPAFRAKQVAQWVFKHGATSFDEMTNLPAPLRAQLAEAFAIDILPVIAERTADDGSTTKVLLDLGAGDAVEAVRMDYDSGDEDPEAGALPDRTTVCISTQVGCAMGCTFCATGQQGFTRNLSPAEILAQLLHFTRQRRVTNVVFMGMGEPLANYEATVAAIRWMVRPEGLDMRQRGITVSTVGLVRAIDRLGDEGFQIGLTVSLHAPDDDLRRQLIRTAGGVTIDGLVDAARGYIAKRGRRVTFAYALLDHVNDSPEQARALAARIRGIQAHVNLIPYNPTAGPGLRPPSRERVRAFQRELQAHGVNATVRVERGQEIAAACGQLRTDVMNQQNPGTQNAAPLELSGTASGGAERAGSTSPDAGPATE
ncbi:MAG: 23S rRNA (adenine(2503)-C(2))-methyltransferase RlmN [Dehalococcoidia bacterium]|nr:23S rRNA (adenine(2503)-C(2))-methyltransferase RlmN [Dehalococcoidia bacterium]MCB9491659.1 23S rRNA (adenine(2503)-C(2))-methyltransferase RlmN [Dehalococcoidia bacterium]